MEVARAVGEFACVSLAFVLALPGILAPLLVLLDGGASVGQKLGFPVVACASVYAMIRAAVVFNDLSKSTPFRDPLEALAISVLVFAFTFILIGIDEYGVIWVSSVVFAAGGLLLVLLVLTPRGSHTSTVSGGSTAPSLAVTATPAVTITATAQAGGEASGSAHNRGLSNQSSGGPGDNAMLIWTAVASIAAAVSAIAAVVATCVAVVRARRG